MHSLKSWRERIRRGRKSPYGEAILSLAVALPVWALVSEIINGLTWPVVAIGAIVMAIAVLVQLFWHQFRGTTKPIFLLPAVVEVGLLAVLLLGLHFWLDPALWKTLALALIFLVVETAHRLTMPRHWVGPETDADVRLMRVSAQKRNHPA